VTRRQSLAVAAASLIGLAGCATPDRRPPDTATAADARPTPPAHHMTSPDATTLPVVPTPAAPHPTPNNPGAATVLGRAEIVDRYRSSIPTVWGLTTPGVLLRLPTREAVVALTFDACGGPHPTSAGCGYDRDLIELLRRYQARATLFLNERWIAANPAIARDLVDDPLFEIGNHGTRHLPLSVTGRSAYKERGTADPGEVYDEITGNRDNLAALTGHAPRWFRPGTAFCDDVAVRIAADLDSRIAGFSVNGDAGTTFTRAQVIDAVGTARAGDIVISHMNRPAHQTAEGYREALPRLLDRGLRPVTLSQNAF